MMYWPLEDRKTTFSFRKRRWPCLDKHCKIIRKPKTPVTRLQGLLLKLFKRLNSSVVENGILVSAIEYQTNQSAKKWDLLLSFYLSRCGITIKSRKVDVVLTNIEELSSWRPVMKPRVFLVISQRYVIYFMQAEYQANAESTHSLTFYMMGANISKKSSKLERKRFDKFTFFRVMALKRIAFLYSWPANQKNKDFL